MSRDKTLSMLAHVYNSFDNLINISIEGLDGADPATLPPELQHLLQFTRSALASKRAEYNDTHASLIEARLTEEEIAGILAFHETDTNQRLVTGGLLNSTLTNEDIDTVAAFLKSPAGIKFREVSKSLKEELQEATARWRNAALEPHREEINKILGAVEPAPLPPAA